MSKDGHAELKQQQQQQFQHEKRKKKKYITTMTTTTTTTAWRTPWLLGQATAASMDCSGPSSGAKGAPGVLYSPELPWLGFEQTIQ